MTYRSALLLVMLLALCACSSKEEGRGADGDGLGSSGDGGSEDRDAAASDEDDSGNDDDDDDDAGGSGSDGDDASNGDAAGGGSSEAGSSGDAGPARAEVCDGVDNDRNGVIDDIDKEKDGVCDCLNIATIGEIGPWSNGGNVFKTWLDARSDTPAVALGNQVLTDALLSKFQVIVVLYVGSRAVTANGRTIEPYHAFTADEIAALNRWVRAGGGLMTTTGYDDENSEVTNMNLLLNPLGAGYSTSKKDVDGFVMKWEPHPITANITKIRTANGVQPDGPQGMTLARDGGDRVALQVTQTEGGRIAVWGDEWITYDSEWSDTADQQVDRLWLNLLKWLSPPKVCQVELPPIVLQ